MKKILFDTDIGTDIDDAVCLAYLLAQPECDLLGITTVTGEANRRAMLASALCKRAGKTVPIYPGAERPLLIEQKQKKADQADALSGWAHDTDFPAGQAVEFLRSTIRAHPGEITLLAVGPLTNIGLLFRVDPEVPQLLQSLVLMCGVFEMKHGWREWNAIGDPHATAIVYSTAVNTHRSIGLDVTRQVVMDRATVTKRFRHELLQPVLDFSEVWFQRRRHICFHDPLAAATIFASPCRFQRGTVEVELGSSKTAGMTHWSPQETGPHEVALEVDPEGFFEHYFSLFA